MAGHSKFKNIQFRKGAQDAKRAKVFTKLIRELTVAAKNGDDPDANPRLRAAIAASKTANMAKDTMERAIARGAGNEDTEQYEEIRYEGYGPKGVAVIVEALTDNRNRTASVNFMFDQVGQIIYPADVASADEVFEAALEAGAQDVQSSEDGHEIICAVTDFNEVRDGLEAKFGSAESAALSWKPQNTIELDAEGAGTMLKLIDALEDNDDVQNVSSNFEIDDDVLAQLAG